MGKQDRAITIIGCGPGSPDYVTPASVAAARKAEVLIGAERLLQLFADMPAERIPVGGAVDETLDRLEERFGRKRVGVLVTGDPGLFSLARLVIRRFGRENCRVIPGISSVQTAFARIGLDWSDATIISAHKQDPNLNVSWADADKIAVLAGRKDSLQWIAEHLIPLLDNRLIFLCENLTLKDEVVREVEPERLRTLQASPQSVVLIVKRSLLA
jgi:cobalt-precorrin-7 (C5)-methyltransferase